MAGQALQATTNHHFNRGLGGHGGPGGLMRHDHAHEDEDGLDVVGLHSSDDHLHSHHHRLFPGKTFL